MGLPVTRFRVIEENFVAPRNGVEGKHDAVQYSDVARELDPTVSYCDSYRWNLSVTVPFGEGRDLSLPIQNVVIDEGRADREPLAVHG
ncbi:MAG: hypothetical protein ACI835_000015 [Planctomycetota bacterium]|jgi:hypothetical protein